MTDLALVVVALLALTGTIISARSARRAASEAAREAASAVKEAADKAADAAREGSLPAQVEALGDRLDKAFGRIDKQDQVIEEQDATIRAQGDTIEQLRREVQQDTEVRHKLKTGLVYIVGVARQLIVAVLEVFTDDQIAGLPQPARRHVADDEDFETYLELARARDR